MDEKFRKNEAIIKQNVNFVLNPKDIRAQIIMYNVIYLKKQLTMLFFLGFLRGHKSHLQVLSTPYACLTHDI